MCPTNAGVSLEGSAAVIVIGFQEKEEPKGRVGVVLRASADECRGQDWEGAKSVQKPGLGDAWDEKRGYEEELKGGKKNNGIP